MATRKVELSAKQQEVIDAVVTDNSNVFITGAGGTGKSLLLSTLVDTLRAHHGRSDSVAVTASTGRAAFNISGCTLHSFAGIGLGAEEGHVLVQKLRFKEAVKSRWVNTASLIVDEVSMISGELFDKIDYVARNIRGSQLPFGGIQMILVGDLLQLPPVGANNKVQKVFQSSAWSQCRLRYFVLTKVFRQEDLKFAEALSHVRVGGITNLTREFMEKICRPVTYEDGLVPVNLYASRARADEHNGKMLDAIASDPVTYTAVDWGRNRNSLEQCPAPPLVTLKKGAQVMLIRNMKNGLVNGTVGEVLSFVNIPDGTSASASNVAPLIPIVRFSLSNGDMKTRPIYPEKWETAMPSGSVICSRVQIPLILAWAMTIHKSQGHTIQRLRVDLQGIFECGQTYTALSRAVGTPTLEVVNYSDQCIRADPDSVKFCIENGLISQVE